LNFQNQLGKDLLSSIKTKKPSDKLYNKHKIHHKNKSKQYGDKA